MISNGAITYIKNRLKEMSTLDGAAMISIGVAYLMFSGLAEYLAYGAIAYGAYRVLTSDKHG